MRIEPYRGVCGLALARGAFPGWAAGAIAGRLWFSLCGFVEATWLTCSPSTRARPVRARSSSMRRGACAALAQAEFPQHFPAPDRVEHDPQDILRTQFDCAREALANAGVAAREVAAIGIANQRETTVLWERASGRALAPAIVWQDRRTAGECARLRAEGWADDVRARTGLELDPYFSATKLAWLLDHVPGARARRARRARLRHHRQLAGLASDGGRLHLTDPGNASRTMLFNLHTLAGIRCCSSASAFRRAAAAGGGEQRRVRRDRREAVRRRDPDRRHRRRPAGGHLRPGLPRAPAWPRTPMAPAASC
jgi:hypothetical protein